MGLRIIVSITLAMLVSQVIISTAYEPICGVNGTQACVTNSDCRHDCLGHVCDNTQADGEGRCVDKQSK